MRKCPKCHIPKTVTDFATRIVDGVEKLSCWCIECRRKQSKSNHAKTKNECLLSYGKICSCCGEWRYEFLAIDHVDGGGNEHRLSLGKNGSRLVGTGFYLWLKKNNWPPGFRVLCHNCNFSIGAYGYCPHSTPTMFTEDYVTRRSPCYVSGEMVKSSKYSDNQIREMILLKRTGKSNLEIMKAFGISKAHLYKVISGKARKAAEAAEAVLVKV